MFGIATIGVCAIAIVVGAVAWLRGEPTLRSLGRQGSTWFERSDERELSELPSEEGPDDPIPQRPLRGRPD